MVRDERRHGAPHQLAARPADDVADEEDGGHARSTGIMSIEPRRSSRRGRTMRSSPRGRGRARLRRIDGAGQPHGAREAAVAALGEVIAHAPGRRCGASFAPTTKQRVAANRDAHRVRPHAGDVDDDLERGRRFEDVERRPAFGVQRRHARNSRSSSVSSRRASSARSTASWSNRCGTSFPIISRTRSDGDARRDGPACDSS